MTLRTSISRDPLAIEGSALSDDHRYELRSAESAQPDEEFDRVNLALRLLRWIAPKRMRVAVFEHRGELRIEVGRELGRSERLALLAIPAGASRAHIAAAIAELAGVSGSPFAADLLSLAASSAGPC